MSLSIFTIYDHPTDYPNHFVAREFVIAEGKAEPLANSFMLHVNIENLHDHFRRKGLIFIPRDPDDDEKIIGVYL